MDLHHWLHSGHDFVVVIRGQIVFKLDRLISRFLDPAILWRLVENFEWFLVVYLCWMSLRNNVETCLVFGHRRFQSDGVGLVDWCLNDRFDPSPLYFLVNLIDKLISQDSINVE